MIVGLRLRKYTITDYSCILIQAYTGTWKRGIVPACARAKCRTGNGHVLNNIAERKAYRSASICEHNSADLRLVVLGHNLTYHRTENWDTLFAGWKKSREGHDRNRLYKLWPMGSGRAWPGHGEWLIGGTRTKSHDDPPLNVPSPDPSSSRTARVYLDDPRCLSYPSAAILGPRCKAMGNERAIGQRQRGSKRGRRGIARESGGGWYKERCRNAT